MSSYKVILFCLSIIFVAADFPGFPNTTSDWTHMDMDCSSYARNCESGLQCMGPVTNKDLANGTNYYESLIFLCVNSTFCKEPTY